MGTVRVLDEEGHPVVGSLLCGLRDRVRQTDRWLFRSQLRRLGFLLGYEVAKSLPTRAQEVVTPLGRRIEPELAHDPVLATLLRAGLPLLDGLFDAFPRSDTVILGAARREGVPRSGTLAMEVDLGYQALVPLTGRTLLYVDPMIATGSSLRAVHAPLLERAGRPERVLLVGVIAYRGALESLAADLDADILVASADDGLDDRGYIVPGLGDAGDLAFGEKLPNVGL